jgi:hypothetical protein
VIKVLLTGLLVVAVAVGVIVMREALETRHEVMPPGSHLVVDASASVRGPREHAPSLARGLVAACIVEAATDSQVVRFTWQGEGRFRFVTRPALDEPDRRQLRGCLEDLRVPRLLVSVHEMAVDRASASSVGAVGVERAGLGLLGLELVGVVEHALGVEPLERLAHRVRLVVRTLSVRSWHRGPPRRGLASTRRGAWRHPAQIEVGLSGLMAGG